MESSRARIIGPAIAVGAVSAGLILIGACGVGSHDTYVPPPPLKNGPAMAAAQVHSDASSTAPKVIIPPSPSWQMAPNAPRLNAGFTVPPSSTSTETTPQPGQPTDSDDSTTTTPARPTTTSDEPLSTTRPHPTTTTRPPRPTTHSAPADDSGDDG
ncbi:MULTISPECIES: hypothetical protein [unclassified Nocardia]|uniref:hypothetical protein n=1 Tax=unclassified Nocardia TaxID=2637762 RepID=UPI001CE4683E|nr:MULTISPECIES: hypothetical protein [unclassified Nocardia]